MSKIGYPLQTLERTRSWLDFEKNSLLVIGFVCLIVLASLSIAFLSPEQSEPVVLLILAILAMIGVFGVFALAFGILRIGEPESREHNLTFAFADQFMDALVITDSMGTIFYANRAYKRLVGRQEDLPTVEQIFSGNTQISDRIFRLSRAAQRQQAWEEDIRLESFGSSEDKDHKVRWFRVNVFPLKDLESTSDRANPVVWKITETTGDRVQQEAAYGKLQNTLAYFDQAPTGFFSLQEDWQFSYLNATLAQWLGYDPAAIRSRSFTLDKLVSDTSATLLRRMAVISQTEGTQELDLDLLKSDGTSLPVRLLLRGHTDAANRTQVQVAVLNRFAKKETGEEARTAEVRFAQFFHSAPIAIATVAADGRIGNTNTAFSTMFQRGDNTIVKSGGSIFDFVDKADREALNRALLAACAGRVEITPVDITLGAHGERNGRLYVSPVDLGTVNGESAILYAIDTTEQKALEIQIAQSQKMQAVGQLAGGIAHDFNNVLTAIIGFSDLLLGSHRPTDPAFQDIMNIKQNANRAAGLVRQLLAFSRQQTLRPEVLALGDVVEDLRVLLSRLIGEKINLNVVHGRDLWFVKADINQFEQVIINLAVNARDAMVGGGYLTIKTSNISERESQDQPGAIEAGEYVLIEVGDTGCGIDEQIIEKIFDPFFSTKEVGKGTGLGLSTVYGIVKQTGGYIYADSEIGKGTNFRIYLPRHIEEVTAETSTGQRSDKREKPKDLTGSGCVLLVEDEEAVRSFAARALASRGYQVLEASTGADALEVMENHDGPLDLVVSDVVMPEMDGPTLLKELRKRNPDLKIIFISGYAEDAFKKNLEDGEQFAFLPKPFSLKQLAGAVKDALQS